MVYWDWCQRFTSSELKTTTYIIRFPRNLILIFSRYKMSCITQKITWIPFTLLPSCFLGKWKVFSWLLPSRVIVSTQIMVRDYWIAKCINFSACVGLLMALQTNFFLWLKIFSLITTVQEYGKLKKIIPWQEYFKDFVHIYKTDVQNANFFQVFFKDSVDSSQLTNVKMDFFEVVFPNFCG